MIYTVNAYSDEPIMLINKHIGADEEDGPGIDGSLFQNELLQLDAMGKKRIQVWINSIGGTVMDAYNIVSAILKSKTPVDTYNVGIAASSAGVIFMTGRKRIMADYSLFMMHNPSGGNDSKSLDAIGGSLVSLLTAKSKLTQDDVQFLMDRTSWLTASECFAKGFCTDIEATKDVNQKYMPIPADVKARVKECNLIVNKILNSSNKTTKIMTKITMKLGLNEAATEDNIVEAIKTIENRAYQAETKIISIEDKHATEVRGMKDTHAAEVKQVNDKLSASQSELKSVKDSLAAKEKELADIKAKHDVLQKEKDDAVAAQKKVEAETMVQGYAKKGRIKNEEKVITMWVNKAIEDLEGTKEMLEALPVNKKAEVITIENKLGEGELATNAMTLAVKNRLKRQGKLK